MRLPYCVDTEVPQEGPVWRAQEGDGRDTRDAGGPHGRRGDRGGQRLPGPHPHMPADGAEAQRGQRGGEAEGKGRDSVVRAPPRVALRNGPRPHALGARLLRQYRRAERDGDTLVRTGAGGRQPHRVGWGGPPRGRDGNTARRLPRLRRNRNMALQAVNKAPGYAGGLFTLQVERRDHEKV